MAGPIAIDTPDYQRGLVTAQKLLASVPAGVNLVTVGVPPNAETLIVNAEGNLPFTFVSCQGVSTGMFYAGAPIPNLGTNTGVSTWFFDVASVADEQVQITFTPTSPDKWYVYADAAAHIVTDVSGLQTLQSVKYVTAVPPSTLSSDHPPNELQLVSLLDATNGTALVPAPGAGMRLRVFYAFVNAASTATFVALRTSVGGGQIVGLSATTGNTAAQISCAPSGVPLAVNQGINIISSSGSADGTVVYTVETV